MSLLLLLLLLPLLQVDCNRIYYVRSNQSNTCPVSSECYTLNYLLSHAETFFISNTTFVFLDGTHFLDQEVSISTVDNLTFRGQSLLVQPIITCGGGFGWLNISASTKIEIIGIAIANCSCSETDAIASFYNIGTLLLSFVSVYDNKGLAMSIESTQKIVVHNCMFSRNGILPYNSRSGNVLIESHEGTPLDCTITNTTFNAGIGFYSGLTVYSYRSPKVCVNLYNLVVNNNTSHGSRGSANINVYIVNSTVETVNLLNIVSSKGISIHEFDSQGGGLYLSFDNLSCNPQTQINVRDCWFSHNFATSGSGAFLYFNGVSHCKVRFDNSSFIGNGHYLKYMYHKKKLQVCTEGGGLLIEDNNSAIDNRVLLINTHFTHNGALFGGAFMQATSIENTLTITNSTFEANTGFIGSAIVGYFMSKPGSWSNVDLENVIVRESTRYSTDEMRLLMGSRFSYSHHIRHDNYISAAIVFASGRYPFIINATDLIVQDNYNVSGMALRGVNIRFKGRNNAFINNSSPEIGGGLVILTTNNFFEVNNGDFLSFVNNRAKLGGAVYFTDLGLDEYDISYIDASYNYAYNYYHCSFITDQNFDGPHNKSNHLVGFENNSALVAGDDVYGGMYRVCNIVPNGGVELLSQLNCPLTRYWTLSNEGSVSSLPFAVCSCNESNDDMNCSERHFQKQLYPGQQFSISLVTVGTCEGISPGTIVTLIEGGNITTSTRNQLTLTHCKMFMYSVTSFRPEANVTISAARSQFTIASIVISIKFLSCPIGFQPSPENGKCVCDPAIRLPGNQVTCSIEDIASPFKRSSNNWIAYNVQQSCTIAYVGCPFDYCNSDLVSFSITNPDKQCAYNRTGTLCGQCQAGLSLMLGSDRCGVCTNSYLLLVIFFMIAGVVLIAILVVFDLTVSSGRINGLLFYANIVMLNESAFFPNGSVPIFLRQFIAWLNLDLGISICFYNGLNGYWKTWLQFAFPIYLWLLSIAIIIGCRKSLKLSRILGPNAVPVLATLLLMSYTKLLRNITDVFMFSTVSCVTNTGQVNNWPVWSVDGTISYFSSSRIPLLVFTAFNLLTAALFTALLTSSQWLQRCSYKSCCCKSCQDPVVRLKPLIDAYCGPYKDKCRYWTGLLLLVRLVITGVFSFTSSMGHGINSIVIILLVLLLLSLTCLIGGMYQNQKLTVLEVFFYFKVGCIALAGYTSSQVIQTVSIIISISVAVLLLILVCGYAFLKRFTVMKCWLSVKKSRDQQLLLDNENYSSPDPSPPGSPALILMRRESLIFDFDINKSSI